MTSLHKPAIIVAGMGRCGSSLTMQMLHRAGVPCVGTFPAFETDHSSFSKFDGSFVVDLKEHAIKLLDPMRLSLPPLENHIVIWLDRDPKDQADSMAKLLGGSGGVTLGRNARRQMVKSLKRDRAPNLNAFRAAPVLPVLFGNLIHPFHMYGAFMIADFLNAYGWEVNPREMIKALIPRGPECMPGMLEFKLLEGAAA